MIDVVTQIAETVRRAGGRAYLVGGTVRDALLKLQVKDYDLEIFGLTPAQIRNIIETFGPVKEVGQAFGILKLTIDGHEIDVAAPRRDSKTGPGHRGFAVAVDPTLSTMEASRRRDFTVNAMLQDPLTAELIDHFGGQQDVAARVLRVTDPQTFIDDPLRLLRAFQFAARFELQAEPKTMALLSEMVPMVKELPKDRLREEWVKLFLKAAKPSIGLRLAQQVGYFNAYPEFAKLPTIEQGAETHPEGDVWTHTLMAVDQAQFVAHRDKLSDEDRLIALLGTLCHDVGKAVTTTFTGGRIRTDNHELAGMPPARRWLADQGFSEDVIDRVVALVRDHMQLHQLYQSDKRDPVGDGAIRRVMRRLQPATLPQLLTVCEGDFRGRGPWHDAQGREVWPSHYPRRTWFEKRVTLLGLSEGHVPIIQGRDLIALGWTPGPSFGQVIGAAEECAERTGATKEDILAFIKEAGTVEGALVVLKERK